MEISLIITLSFKIWRSTETSLSISYPWFLSCTWLCSILNSNAYPTESATEEEHVASWYSRPPEIVLILSHSPWFLCFYYGWVSYVLKSYMTLLRCAVARLVGTWALTRAAKIRSNNRMAAVTWQWRSQWNLGVRRCSLQTYYVLRSLETGNLDYWGCVGVYTTHLLIILF